MKDAFEKPFRNQSTNAAFSLGSQTASQPRNLGSSANEIPPVGANDKGKEKEAAPPSLLVDNQSREPSPVWDIELDLV